MKINKIMEIQSKLKKRQYSLRSILIFCLFVLSFFPVVFLSFYSIRIFEKGIDKEIFQRVSLAESRLQNSINEKVNFLSKKILKFKSNKVLMFYISSENNEQLEELLKNNVIVEKVPFVRVFDNQGRSIFSLTRKDLKVDYSQKDLNIDFIKVLDTHKIVTVIEKKKKQIELNQYSNIKSDSGLVVGFLQISFILDNSYLREISKRYNINYIYKDNFEINSIVEKSTSLTKNDVRSIDENFQSLIIDKQYYRAKKFTVSIGEEKLDFIVAVPTTFAQNMVNTLQSAYLIVLAVMSLLLIVLSIFITNLILKPIKKLIVATNNPDFENTTLQEEEVVETEIGVLTKNFNMLFFKVREARDKLNNKIKELENANATIKNTQVKLVHSAKMISLGELVAGVAHELNNPIGFIYSNMSHLKEYMDSLVDIVQAAEKNPNLIKDKKKEHEFDYIISDLPKLIKSCEDGAQRTKDIVLSLRNFSRLDEAKQKIIDINEAIENTLYLLNSEHKNRIELILDFDKNLPKLNCFPSQLNQVFMNILSNAFQSIQDRGKVYISTYFDKMGLSISIRDTGSGIDEKHIDKIFDPFFTTKEQGKGTGLGLSISYSIIQKHNGDIIVKSKKGEGTEFIILLPINNDELKNV